jgi:hypothetical protein
MREGEGWGGVEVLPVMFDRHLSNPTGQSSDTLPPPPLPSPGLLTDMGWVGLAECGEGGGEDASLSWP